MDWARAKWGDFAAKYIKWGETQAVKHADKIIVLSKGVQEYFKSAYNRDTVFIPNGVIKLTSQPADEIKKLWKLEKDSYVLFLGRIVPEKGLRYLVEAWNGIRTDKKLVIAGGSSDTESFLNELKDMAGDNVIFTGFQQGRVISCVMLVICKCIGSILGINIFTIVMQVAIGGMVFVLLNGVILYKKRDPLLFSVLNKIKKIKM